MEGWLSYAVGLDPPRPHFVTLRGYKLYLYEDTRATDYTHSLLLARMEVGVIPGLATFFGLLDTATNEVHSFQALSRDHRDEWLASVQALLPLATHDPRTGLSPPNIPDVLDRRREVLSREEKRARCLAAMGRYDPQNDSPEYALSLQNPILAEFSKVDAMEYFENRFMSMVYPLGWELEDHQPAENACLCSVPLMKVSVSFSYGLCEHPMTLEDCSLLNKEQHLEFPNWVLISESKEALGEQVYVKIVRERVLTETDSVVTVTLISVHDQDPKLMNSITFMCFKSVLGVFEDAFRMMVESVQFKTPPFLEVDVFGGAPVKQLSRGRADQNAKLAGASSTPAGSRAVDSVPARGSRSTSPPRDSGRTSNSHGVGGNGSGLSSSGGGGGGQGTSRAATNYFPRAPTPTRRTVAADAARDKDERMSRLRRRGSGASRLPPSPIPLEKAAAGRLSPPRPAGPPVERDRGAGRSLPPPTPPKPQTNPSSTSGTKQGTSEVRPGNETLTNPPSQTGSPSTSSTDIMSLEEREELTLLFQMGAQTLGEGPPILQFKSMCNLLSVPQEAITKCRVEFDRYSHLDPNAEDRVLSLEEFLDFSAFFMLGGGSGDSQQSQSKPSTSPSPQPSPPPPPSSSQPQPPPLQQQQKQEQHQQISQRQLHSQQELDWTLQGHQPQSQHEGLDPQDERLQGPQPSQPLPPPQSSKPNLAHQLRSEPPQEYSQQPTAPVSGDVEQWPSNSRGATGASAEAADAEKMMRSFDKEVLGAASGDPVVVYFFGEPSPLGEEIQVVLEELSLGLGISTMEIDTTIAASVPLKKRFGISEAPMVLVFVDGQLQARLGPDLNPEMIMDAVVPE